MFELRFLSGARAGAVINITATSLAGRSPDCPIEVPDANVSRNHAQFDFDGTVLSVHDCGSSNGTFVNEQRISEVELSHGDIVRMGETRIRVQRRSHRNSTSTSEGHSSVFGFSETGADLSQSIVMSRLQPPVADMRRDDLEARLHLVLWVSEQLASIKSLDDLYGPVLETLFDVFPQVDRGFLMLGSEYDDLVPKAYRLRDGKTDEEQRISSTLCREALRRKEIITWTDTGGQEFDQAMSIVQLEIRSAMVVPLMVSEEVLGLLLVDTKHSSEVFTTDDMKLAEAVCRQVANSIKNTMLVEDLERETRTRDNLSRFLPRPVVDQAVGGEIDLRLGGSLCCGTIFFADIIGFTRLAEKMKPEDVIGMMNGFFDRMVPVIESQNGAIDKFMGDCIMAFWGIPFDYGDASFRAAQAGLMMQNLLCGLNSARASHGRPSLHMGIGLDSGEVVAGNIGTEDRVEYTVLGNTVNTTQRIQSCACRGQVLLGESAWQDLGDKAFGIRLPPVAVKNKTDPIDVLSLRGLVSDYEVVLHVPIVFGDDQPGIITRRLSDGQFVLMHEREHSPADQPARSAMVELPGVDFGNMQVNARLPDQTSDGVLKRSQVRFDDASLGGLLDPERQPLATQLTWDEMDRGGSVG